MSAPAAEVDVIGKVLGMVEKHNPLTMTIAEAMVNMPEALCGVIWDYVKPKSHGVVKFTAYFVKREALRSSEIVEKLFNSTDAYSWLEHYDKKECWLYIHDPLQPRKVKDGGAVAKCNAYTIYGDAATFDILLRLLDDRIHLARMGYESLLRSRDSKPLFRSTLSAYIKNMFNYRNAVFSKGFPVTLRNFGEDKAPTSILGYNDTYSIFMNPPMLFGGHQQHLLLMEKKHISNHMQFVSHDSRCSVETRIIEPGGDFDLVAETIIQGSDIDLRPPLHREYMKVKATTNDVKVLETALGSVIQASIHPMGPPGPVGAPGPVGVPGPVGAPGFLGGTGPDMLHMLSRFFFSDNAMQGDQP